MRCRAFLLVAALLVPALLVPALLVPALLVVGGAPANAAQPVTLPAPSVALSTPVFSLRRVPALLSRTVADAHLGADLDRALTLTDGVLRHKVVRLPEKATGKPARPLGAVGPDGPGEPVPPAPESSPVAAP